MEREPGEIRRAEPSDDIDATATIDDALSSWLKSLPPCLGIGFVDDNVEEADRLADADILARRTVPHEQVAAWAAKLGAADEVPMPPEWLA